MLAIALVRHPAEEDGKEQERMEEERQEEARQEARQEAKERGKVVVTRSRATTAVDVGTIGATAPPSSRSRGSGPVVMEDTEAMHKDGTGKEDDDCKNLVRSMMDSAMAESMRMSTETNRKSCGWKTWTR